MTAFVLWTMTTSCAAILFGGLAHYITLIRGWAPFLLVLVLATSADTLVVSGMAFQGDIASGAVGSVLLGLTAGCLMAGYILGRAFAFADEGHAPG